MTSLFNFILEQLIQSGDLRENIKFEECSINDVEKILSTDEYSRGAKLGFGNNIKKDLSQNVFGSGDDEIWYKITYKNELLGITGINYLKNYKTSKSNCLNFIVDLLNSEKLIRAYNYENADDLLHDSIYIILLQLSNNAKKKIDISPIALIKVFYEKLIEIVKNNDCKIICAHGKDDKTTKSYIKVGGFDSYNDKFLTKKIKTLYENIYPLYKNFVIKKI